MDPDQLALLALGEAHDAAVGDHLRRCPACRAEVEALRHTVTLARDGVEHRDEPALSEAVWGRIAAETGIGPVPYGRHAAQAATGPPASRRHRWVRPAVALLAAAVVGVAGALGVLQPWRSDQATVTGSTAALSAVAGGPSGVSGRATVVQGKDGRVLDVTARGLPLQPGYYEVWVFDGKRDMVSVGVLGGDSTAALPLPATLDLRTYHVIDISAEPYDGDQTHSADSVLRGTLTD